MLTKKNRLQKWLSFSGKSGIMTAIDLKKKRIKLIYFCMFAFLLLIVFISLYPLLWIFFTSFQENPFSPGFFPDSMSWGAISLAWNGLGFGGALLNSMIIVVIAVVASVVFNGLAAFSLSHVKPVGTKVIFFLIMATLMVPAVTNMVPLFQNLATLQLLNNHIPLGIVFGANAFYLIMFKVYFDMIPKSVVESARLDGAGNIRVFFKIILPMSISIVAVVAIFTINAAWSDFMLPFLVLDGSGMETVMTALLRFQINERIGTPQVLMGAMLAIFPPIILFLMFQRRITSNVMGSAVKG